MSDLFYSCDWLVLPKSMDYVLNNLFTSNIKALREVVAFTGESKEKIIDPTGYRYINLVIRVATREDFHEFIQTVGDSLDFCDWKLTTKAHFDLGRNLLKIPHPFQGKLMDALNEISRNNKILQDELQNG